jgi:Cd2+/Zn2+-exporting ATPase
MSDDVEKVDYVIHLGKRARRVIRQNVYVSLGWMAMLVVVAVTIGIPLSLAVVGHEGEHIAGCGQRAATVARRTAPSDRAAR